MDFSRLSSKPSFARSMPDIDLNPNRNLVMNENRWIALHELLSWIDGVLGWYGGEDMAPFEVASLFRYLIRAFSGAEGGNIFPGEYLYYIRHDHIEMQYRFYRMKGSDNGFYVDKIERFINGRWEDRWDDQPSHDVFMMDDASGEILVGEPEVNTPVDEQQYINIIFGDESVENESSFSD